MASSSATLPPLLVRQGKNLGPVARAAQAKAAKRHARKQDQKQDGLLRKAVELYHIAPAFFPMPERASRSKNASAEATPNNAKWVKDLDTTIYSAILKTDAVSRRTPNLVPRTLQEYARDRSARAASVSTLATSGEWISRRSRDAYSFASDLTSTTFMTQAEREEQAGKLSPHSKKTSSPSGTSLSHFTDRDIAMYQRRHSDRTSDLGSPPLDGDRHSGAERPSHLERVTAGGNEWYGSQNLDARSARVRDAIFGTVSGELPGLDIVRQRFREMRPASTNPGPNDQPIAREGKDTSTVKAE